MPIPNSRSRPPRILAHELRWGRGGAGSHRPLTGVVPEFDCRESCSVVKPNNPILSYLISARRTAPVPEWQETIA